MSDINEIEVVKVRGGVAYYFGDRPRAVDEGVEADASIEQDKAGDGRRYVTLYRYKNGEGVFPASLGRWCSPAIARAGLQAFC